MLRLVWDDERPATELADAAGMSKSAASQHLELLRDAGLVTVRVDASRRLYRADLQPFVQWMADDATLDPRPGGVVRWTHASGDTCAGEYVELVPARRVVFTYGWERGGVENADDRANLPGEAKSWDLAETLLERADVTRSTMIGLPCLRWNGAFFASWDPRTGDLVVKLAQIRVDELVACGRANSFAPAGRRFREWAAVPEGTVTVLEASAR